MYNWGITISNNPFLKLTIFIWILFFLQINIFAQKVDSISSLKSAFEVKTTQHQVKINEKSIKYKASAGYLVLKDENNKPKANIFYIAYIKEDETDLSVRPVTFSFNGGPGSSSVWLHLGTLGPKKVFLTDEGEVPPPPYKFVPNDDSWLDLTDLVFIDPVSTGYSRPAEGQSREQFYGYRNDISWVGEFIRLYTTQNKRWESPKFIIGESYGTTRASGLSDYLANTYGMYLNGIVLVSSVLDFQTILFTQNNELPYILYLPAYAATAFYHKRLSDKYQENLSKTLEEVKDFAMNQYSIALLKGDVISPDELNQISEKLAQYTSLPSDYIKKNHLRISPSRFRKKLLEAESLNIGRFDSRYFMYDKDLTGENIENDASYIGIDGVFSACMNHYVRKELNYENDIPYEILTGKVHPWSLESNAFLNVAGTLASTMRRNPHMKVWVASGYYDLATPFFATEYTFDHLQLNPDQRKNLIMTYYEAGHMMYLRKTCLAELKSHASTFYRSYNFQK